MFDAFRRALDRADAPCSGGVGRDEVTLRMNDPTRRPWSPWIQLSITSVDEHVVLAGHMGPAPELWTAFVFTYSLLVATFIGGSMFGMVQQNLGQSPSGLGVAGLAIVGLGLSCGLDLLGRRVGQGQMGILRGFIRRTVPDAIDDDAP